MRRYASCCIRYTKLTPFIKKIHKHIRQNIKAMVSSLNEILCSYDIYLCIKDYVKDYCWSYLFYDISRQVARNYFPACLICRGRCLHRPAGGCEHPPLQIGGRFRTNGEFLLPLTAGNAYRAMAIAHRGLPAWAFACAGACRRAPGR